MKDVILMQQIHGNNVVMVGKKDIGTTIPNCDAMITSDPGVTLGVRVADCLPIFVVDEKGRGIGLIHAGWRGLENEIIVKTIQKMENQWKMETGKLKIIIGPHICPEHYEVKEDVASKFSSYVKGVTLNVKTKFSSDSDYPHHSQSIFREAVVGITYGLYNSLVDIRLPIKRID